MTEVFMQRLLMVLLVISLSGSAIAEKIDADFFKTALAGLELIERVEKIYQSKNKEEKKKKHSSSKFKK
jgi:hypothetical protein